MNNNIYNKDIILAIDPSLRGSSFILGDIKGNINNYIYFSDQKKDIKNSHCIEIPQWYKSKDKFDLTLQKFMLTVGNNNVKFVIMESPSYNSSNCNDEFKAIYSTIAWFLRQVRVQYMFISPVSNKLYFTDNAHANKEDMVKQAVAEYGEIIDFTQISTKHSEDVADSLSMYSIAQNYLCCTSNSNYIYNLPLHRQQVLFKLLGDEKNYKDIQKKRNKLKKNDTR